METLVATRATREAKRRPGSGERRSHGYRRGRSLRALSGPAKPDVDRAERAFDLVGNGRHRMFDLIKAKKHVVKGKAANALFPLIVGLAPKVYLRGINAIVEGERVKRDCGPDSDIFDSKQRIENATQTARLASIAVEAGAQLNDEDDPSRLSANWRERFVVHASHIADEDMHAAWSRVLAGEVRNPGSFSLRTVSTMADMEAEDARLFARVCQFSWRLVLSSNARVLIIFGYPSENELWTATYDDLVHLESLGLLTLADYATRLSAGSSLLLQREGKLAIFGFESDGLGVPMGVASFTRVGRELSQIVDDEATMQGYADYCVAEWQEHADRHPGLTMEYLPKPPILDSA